jgi:hypothetical protein
LEAEKVRALRALCSLRSEKKLLVGNRLETHSLSNEEKKKYIKDYVQRETAVATKRVQDAESTIMQELKDMTTATGKPETTFEEMFSAIADSLSELASSDDEQDGED